MALGLADLQFRKYEGIEKWPNSSIASKEGSFSDAIFEFGQKDGRML